LVNYAGKVPGRLMTRRRREELTARERDREFSKTSQSYCEHTPQIAPPEYIRKTTSTQVSGFPPLVSQRTVKGNTKSPSKKAAGKRQCQGAIPNRCCPNWLGPTGRFACRP